MNTIYTLQQGFLYLLENPLTLGLLMLGVLGGMVFGSIPGLTATLGVSLILPFTFLLSAQEGMTLLISIYVGGISGGLIAAVLLNIPGTPSSVVTCFDGAPMARKGKAIEALTYGVTASVLGGLISGILLMLIAPQLAKLALFCSSWEYFAMGLMGLAIVVSLSSKDLVKGLMAAVIGVLLAMVGIDDVSAVPRFTFGMWQLGAGLDLLATLMGLFALTEILTQVKNLNTQITLSKIKEKASFWPSRTLFKGKWAIICVCSLIGTFIGLLPGVGSSTATLLSYNQARQMSKTPEKFGSGCEDGVLASESSNNAVCGGALIPMMTMGIPGDMVTAVLLGGLIIHGLQPGPLLFTTNQSVVGTVYISYLVANIMMFFLMILLMRVFIKLLRTPLNYLLPVILLMCVVGTISVNNRIFDSWVLLFVGILGFILLNLGFSLPPLILGYVLGPIVESNFRRAMISSNGSILPLFGRPIAIILLLLGAGMIIWPIISKKRDHRKADGKHPA